MPTFTAAYAGARTFFSHLSRAQWPRQGSPLADLVQNLRFQFFPRFAGFARTTDSRGRERYLKGSPGAARARSKPAGPEAGTIVSGDAPSIQSVTHTLFHSRRAALSPADRLLRPRCCLAMRRCKCFVTCDSFVSGIPSINFIATYT